MRPPVVILRLLFILWVLARYNLAEILHTVPQPWKSLVWIFRVVTGPLRLGRRRDSRGTRITQALERLGPLFVKLGQLLSTRRDLIPEDVIEHLVRLREHVAPFSYQKVEEIIERNLGRPIEECFDEFNRVPIASASIAQVHMARLRRGAGDADDGREVAVKVLRPNIRRVIVRDLYVLEFIFTQVQRYFKRYHHLNLLDISRELERILSCEIDLRIEAANCSVLRRQSATSSLLYVPQVYWDYVRTEVMVMERVHGIAVDDLDALRSAGVDLEQLARCGVDLFIEQVFDQDLFHADMHPGNIFVDVSNPKSPGFIAVDFGIVGSLNDQDKQYLARNMVAFFKRDYAQVARLHAASGWLLQDQNGLHDFASELRNVCEPIFEKSSRDISFGDLLQRLFATARLYEIQIQPQLLLLQKTFLNVEGIGRYLYPELNLWTSARSRIESWVVAQLGVRRNAAMIRRTAEDVLWSIPDANHQVQMGMKKLTAALESIERISTRLNERQATGSAWTTSRWYFGIGCTLWICGTLVYVFPPAGLTIWYGLPWASWAAFTLGGLGVSVAWIVRHRDQYSEGARPRRRSRRLL